MQHSINYHETAWQDLMDAWQFIADDQVQNANVWFTTIKTTMAVLAENPLLGRERPDLAKGLRSFPVGRYVILYKVEPDGILVVRVLHGARRIKTVWNAP